MPLFTDSRRNFIKIIGSLTGATLLGKASRAAPSGTSLRPRAAGARYMGGFAAPKLETVRLAFIGVGERGSSHARQLSRIEGTEVVAISDLYEELAVKAARDAREAGQDQRHQNIKLYHENANSWQRMLREAKPDAVIISTPWALHAPMAIETMKADAHAFVEVPMALTVQEMWDIVGTSEMTRKHCMMMENVNYGREELLYLNMCRKGVIGELLHGEAAYIHDLRFQMEQVERGTGSWRTQHYAHRSGNLYPTHGLGPVAQYMNLARAEDTFRRLTSFSSPAKGRRAYARKNFPPEHPWNQLDYQGGDMNTSLVQTEIGRTIMIQWDETSPRPYTRHNLIQGTKGTLAGFPTRVALEGGVEGATEDAHEWAKGEQLQAIFEKHEHPLYQRLGAASKRAGGHGGMDYIMLARMMECLQNGEPLDQNVYEGCFWSVIGPLSEASVAQDGMPQTFPDFTRGEWTDTAPLQIVS